MVALSGMAVSRFERIPHAGQVVLKGRLRACTLDNTQFVVVLQYKYASTLGMGW